MTQNSLQRSRMSGNVCCLLQAQITAKMCDEWCTLCINLQVIINYCPTDNSATTIKVVSNQLDTVIESPGVGQSDWSMDLVLAIRSVEQVESESHYVEIERSGNTTTQTRRMVSNAACTSCHCIGLDCNCSRTWVTTKRSKVKGNIPAFSDTQGRGHAH